MQPTTKIVMTPAELPESYDERLVANVTRAQKKYVQKVAKKYFESESAFIRYVLDYFKEHVSIE